MTPAKITDLALTIAEAAYVSGLGQRVVTRELGDASARTFQAASDRTVEGADLVYLFAIRNLRASLGLALRRRIRGAVRDAVENTRAEAVVDWFKLSIDDLGLEVLQASARLERIKHDEIESRPSVLAGEPVLKGTRVAARHVADLVRRGAPADEIAEDLDLTLDQVEAAVAYDRVAPGRLRVRSPNHVSSSR